jgi:Viral BACON domain/Putative binding domain, N-terminal
VRRYCSADRICISAQLFLCVAAAAACTSSSQQITGPSPAAKCSATVTTSTADFGPEGGDGRLTVTTERDCSWKVETDAAWVTVAATGETQGSGTVSFSVAATGDPVSRSASLAVADQHVAITQRAAACRYRLSAQELTLPAPGGGGGIDVNASSALCEWTAQSDAAWLSMPSGGAYKGSAHVTFQAPPWNGPDRRADVRLADQHLALMQSGGCTFTLASASASVAAAGGRASVSVETGPGCAWTIANSAPWLSLATAGTMSGAATAEFTVTPNAGPARSATVMVANRPFAINQASGCQYQLNPPAYTFATAGGTGSVAVNTAAGCDWTAASDGDWLAITSARTGSGPAAVQINVAANTGPQRTANIQIANQRFVATQLSGCTYSIEPKGWGFPAAGAADWVWVTATPGCYWVATSQASWLSITTGAAGYGSAITYFVVAPNYGPPRQGTLTIAGLTFTAVQEGATATLR